MTVPPDTSPPVATATWLNKIAKQKTKLLAEMFAMEPIHVKVKDPATKKEKPRCQGEDILRVWDDIYGNDPMMKNIVIDTVVGPSTPDRDYYDDPVRGNPAMPYQQLRALVGDGGKWKWPDIWRKLDVLPRRGPAWRHLDDPSNLSAIENPNPDVTPLNCLVVGGGPIGLRLAIELVLGGHRVTLFEARREIIDAASGKFESVGFTNRVNRPHINNFCRNDLDALNGRNFMTSKMCYPVFTNGHTSSIGIDELQMLLLKTALLVGVRFELGVGYVDAAVDVADARTQRPSWMVSYKADDIAQRRYGKDAEGTQRFDALFGCDGGRSRVRETQAEWLGQPRTRSYKKMYGIVSNLRKCSRKKLIEQGFKSGLEPEDRAGNLTGAFFYKASYHNYFIVHPSAQEMEDNNIPWKGVFTFHKAHEAKNNEKDALKATLKKYITKKAKELNIPIDETLENEGFVEAPNDVMGFDFTEFYNCEKSASCFVPPLDWTEENDGEWEIQCPLVAIAGDAVADPNWLLGVGLQRGWNSALDAVFYADNIYNNKSFNGKPPTLEEPISSPVEWSEHMDNFMNLMANLGKNSRESKLSEEMDTGMLDTKGPVVTQISREIKEAPVPQYLPPVSPWGRYKEYQFQVKSNYKGRNLFDNPHPLATRELALFHRNEKYVEEGDVIKRKVNRPMAAMLTWPKRFECSAFWCKMSMKLREIDGKIAPGQEALTNAVPPPPASLLPKEKAAPQKVETPKLNPDEVKKLARRKSMRLRENILQAARSGPSPSGVDSKSRNSLDSLIFHSAGKGKSRSAILEDSMGEPSQDNIPPVSAPEVTTSPGGLFASSDNSRIQIPSLELDQATATADTKIMHKLHLCQINYEKESLKAKLVVAKADIAKIKAEEEAIKARVLFAKAEYDRIENLIEMYTDAETKMCNGSIATK